MSSTSTAVDASPGEEKYSDHKTEVPPVEVSANNERHPFAAVDVSPGEEKYSDHETKVEVNNDSVREKSWPEKLMSLDIPPEELEGLSKNQKKKLYKKKLFEQTRSEKRHKERERKKEKRKALKEAGLEVPRKFRLRDFKDITYCNHNIVIDLDFYDLMNEIDTRMVIKQVNACYSVNRKADFPLKLHASSFCSPIKDLFVKLQPGSPHWDFLFHEKKYSELFPNEKIVYLTSDSENVLQSMEEDKVYIIGGLVDHNQHKGLCLQRAKEKGIAHAQLPINKFVNMSTRKVLTINHVFEILSKSLATKDWKDAFFSVIPKRKGLTVLPPQKSQE